MDHGPAAQGPPPRSASPLRDYLESARHGVDRSYVVVPRAVAESMPMAWQDRFAQLLHELHGTYGGLPWPIYRVAPSRHERLADLDEEQLAEVGCIVEIDADGELRHRDRAGRVIEDPEQHEVLVSCLDPLTRTRPTLQQPGGRQPLRPHRHA